MHIGDHTRAHGEVQEEGRHARVQDREGGAPAPHLRTRQDHTTRCSPQLRPSSTCKGLAVAYAAGGWRQGPWRGAHVAAGAAVGAIQAAAR